MGPLIYELIKLLLVKLDMADRMTFSVALFLPVPYGIRLNHVHQVPCSAIAVVVNLRHTFTKKRDEYFCLKTVCLPARAFVQ